MENIEAEKSALQHGVEVSRMTADRMQAQDKENRNLWKAVAAALGIALVSVLTIFCVAVWAVNNAQEVANKAVTNALETISEMEVSGDTTTTVTQDTGDGGGNAIFQVGEYARYSEVVNPDG